MMPNAGKDADKLGTSHIANKMQNCTDIVENSLTVSCKINIHLPYDPVFILLSIYLRKVKPTHNYSWLYYNTCNKQKLETIQVSFNR